MKTRAPFPCALPLVATALFAATASHASPVIERFVYDLTLNGVTDTVRRSDTLLQDRARLSSGFYCDKGAEEAGDAGEEDAGRALDAFLGSDFSWIQSDTTSWLDGDLYRPTFGAQYQVSPNLFIGANYTRTVADYSGGGGFTADGDMDGVDVFAWYLFECGARIGATLNYSEGETDYSDPINVVMGASWETFRGTSVGAGYGRQLGTPGELGGNVFFDLSGSFVFSHREVMLNNGGTLVNFDYSDIFFAGRTQVGTQLSSCCSLYGLFNVFTCIGAENRAQLSYPFNGFGGINTVPPEIGTYGEVGGGVNWCINERINLNTQVTTSVFNDVFTETRGTLFANFRF